MLAFLLSPMSHMADNYVLEIDRKMEKKFQNKQVSIRSCWNVRNILALSTHSFRCSPMNWISIISERNRRLFLRRRFLCWLESRRLHWRSQENNLCIEIKITKPISQLFRFHSRATLSECYKLQITAYYITFTFFIASPLLSSALRER